MGGEMEGQSEKRWREQNEKRGKGVRTEMRETD